MYVEWQLCVLLELSLSLTLDESLSHFERRIYSFKIFLWAEIKMQTKACNYDEELGNLMLSVCRDTYIVLTRWNMIRGGSRAKRIISLSLLMMSIAHMQTLSRVLMWDSVITVDMMCVSINFMTRVNSWKSLKFIWIHNSHEKRAVSILNIPLMCAFKQQKWWIIIASHENMPSELSQAGRVCAIT